MKTRFALIFLLAFGPAAVSAAEPVGRLLLSAGDVTALRGGASVALANGAAVERGDEIRTGKASSAQIRFADGAIVALRAETVFAVDQFVFKGEQDGSELAVFKLIKGGLRTITGLIGRLHHENYGIVTPTSTIGIRGTHFNLVVCEDACRNADGSIAPRGTYGGVVDGRIALTPNANPGAVRDFGKGEFFFAPSATAPPQQLLAPPAFVADKLEAQQRAAAKTAAADQGGTSTAEPEAPGGPMPLPPPDPAPPLPPPAPAPPAPLPAPIGDSPSGSAIASAVIGTATGFVAQYYTGTAYFSFDSCGGAAGTCPGTSVTQYTPTGNNLLGYSNPPAASPNGSLGSGTIVDAGSMNVAGANYSWGRWTGGFTVTDPSGTYTGLPSGLMFGRTDDPSANGGSKVFPSTGAVSYVLAGGPRPVDSAGNVGTMNSMSGTLDFVTRNVTFTANMSIAVPVQGTASIAMSGGGTLAANNDNLLGLPLSATCTGTGCAAANPAGQFDVRFGGSAAQVMVVNGIASNAVKNSAGSGANSVLFLNLLKCSGC